MLVPLVLLLTTSVSAIKQEFGNYIEEYYNDYDDEYLDEIENRFFVLHAKKRFHEQLNKRDYDDGDDYFESNMTFNSRLAFFIDIEIGSNNDTVSVLVDTGSSDFWVAGYGICESEFYYENSTYDCYDYGYFDADNSSTFTSNNTELLLEYGDTTVAIGYFGQDDINISNITVNDVNFGIANFTNATSGIIGIGYETTESTYFFNTTGSYKYINFPEKLVEDGIINKASYSLYLDEYDNAEILFGAVDHEKYIGKLYQYPIVTMNSSDINEPITRIAITLNTISLSNDTEELIIGDGYIPAVLDSGTTIASFPESISEVLANLLNLTYDYDLDSYYAENCSEIEDIYFNFYFQGIQYTSPVVSYFADFFYENGDYLGCVSQISSSDDDFIILGDSFLRDMYMVIDLEDNMAALAYSNFTNSSISDIEVIIDEIPSGVNPSNNKTFGPDNFLFTYYDSEPVTKSYVPNLATASV
ncbi:hypothetical protein C6P40_004591, partial [Pichia californica]